MRLLPSDAAAFIPCFPDRRIHLRMAAYCTSTSQAKLPSDNPRFAGTNCPTAFRCLPSNMSTQPSVLRETDGTFYGLWRRGSEQRIGSRYNSRCAGCPCTSHETMPKGTCDASASTDSLLQSEGRVARTTRVTRVASSKFTTVPLYRFGCTWWIEQDIAQVVNHYLAGSPTSTIHQ